MTADAKILQLGLELPPAPQPMGVYRPVVISGNHAYLSGHGPLLPDGSLIKGRLGDGADVQQGYHAARQTGLAILASLIDSLTSLERVVQIVKILGLVNCTPDFQEQPQVINGCSELLADVLGPERGIGARSAVGATSLPAGMMVEIEAVVEISVP